VFVIRLVALPIRLALWLAGVSLRVGYQAGRAPLKAGTKAARLMGFKGVVLFGSGLALGLLLAPWPGRELRGRLRDLLGDGGLSDDELAEKVAFELSHAPRTWHLPQPTLSVIGGRVILTGEVPHPEARSELERVAAGIPGVIGVDNQLTVATSAAGGAAEGDGHRDGDG
jgi:hypothetical protein